MSYYESKYTPERYFWHGEHGTLTTVTPRYMAPWPHVTWSPPEGMVIDVKKLFNGYYSRNYVNEITSHGTVTYKTYGVTIEWDKDKHTMTYIPADIPVQDMDRVQARWCVVGINRILRNKPCTIIHGETEYEKNGHPYKQTTGHEDVAARVATDMWPKHKAIILSIVRHGFMDKDVFNDINVLFDKKIVVDMDNHQNNLHLATDYNNWMIDCSNADYERQCRYYRAVLHRKVGMSIMDLEKQGGIKIFSGTSVSSWRSRPGQFPMELARPGGVNFGPHMDSSHYVLRLSDAVNAVKQWYHVQDEAFDGHGSHIWKIIAGHEKVVDAVALIGKEYTGQWWMHYLPTFYATATIATCERWLLDIDADDTLLAEA